MAKVHQAAAIFSDASSFETGQRFELETKASQCRFPNGKRLIALPANPSTARGYSGNLVLDEFAFHEKPERGHLESRLSDHHESASRTPQVARHFDASRDEQQILRPLGNVADFSRHKTTIYDATEAGLHVNIDELRANLNDPDAWVQGELSVALLRHSPDLGLFRQLSEQVDTLQCPEDFPSSLWEVTFHDPTCPPGKAIGYAPHNLVIGPFPQPIEGG